MMLHRLISAGWAVVMLAAVPVRADWIPTLAGPFDYADTNNWTGAAVNGTFSQTLAANQTVTFAADTTLATGWTFNYGGAFHQTLTSADSTARTVTLGGNVSMTSVAGGRTTTIGDATNVLNVNLGGNRTFTVNGTDNLVFVNAIGNGATASALTKAGSGTLTLAGAGNYTGGTTLSAGTLSVSSTGSLSTGALTVNGGTLTLSNAAQSVSALSGTGGTITLNGTALTVDYAGGFPGATFSGAIGGNGSLTKSGSGTLNLNAFNTYTGTTTITAGVLNITSFGRINSGALHISGGSLITAGQATVTQLTGTGTVSVNGGGGFIVNQATDSTFAGTVSAPGAGGAIAGFAKQGAGKLTLTGTFSSSSDVYVSGGTLEAGSSGTFSAGALSVSGSTVSLSGLSANAGRLSGSASGVITLNGSLNFIISGSNNQTTLSADYSGVINGTARLTMRGSFEQALRGASTYSGSTTIEGGPLNVSLLANGGVASNIGASGAASGNLVFGGLGAGTMKYSGGTVSIDRGATLTTNGGTIDVTTAATILTFGGAFVGTTGLTKAGAGTLSLTGSNTYDGATTINAGTLVVSTLANGGAASSIGDSSSASGNLTIGNATFRYTGATVSIDRGATLNNAATIDVSTAGAALSLSGGVGGSGSLTKTGAGALTLSGNATYSGATTLSAGTLTLSGGGNSYSGGTNLNGGVLSVGANAHLGNTSGALNFNGGTLQITGTIFTSTARNITWGSSGGGFDIAAAGNTFTVSQLLSGAGGLTKSGAGTLVLTAINTYTGATNINGGVLQLGANALVTPGGTISIANGAELRAAGYVPRAFVGGGGTVTATGALLLGDLASANGYTFPGALNVGSNTVELLSAGKAKLGSQTNIGAGGLLVTINGALLGGGGNGTTVDATKILSVTAGTGTIQGIFTNNGQVNVAGGAQLVFQNLVDGAGGFAGNVTFNGGWSPGNSPAAVTLEDAVLGQFGTLTMELGGTTAGTQHDTVTIAGTLNLGGALNVTAVNGFAPGAGQTFNLFDGTTTGAFASVALPTLSAGLEWDTSQLYSAGIISVTPVPEPAAVMGLLLLACFVLRRRRV